MILQTDQATCMTEFQIARVALVCHASMECIQRRFIITTYKVASVA